MCEVHSIYENDLVHSAVSAVFSRGAKWDARCFKYESAVYLRIPSI